MATVAQTSEERLFNYYLERYEEYGYNEDHGYPDHQGFNSGSRAGFAYAGDNDAMDHIREQARLAAAKKIVAQENPDQPNAMAAFEKYFGPESTPLSYAEKRALKAANPQEYEVYQLAATTAHAVAKVYAELDGDWNGTKAAEAATLGKPTADASTIEKDIRSVYAQHGYNLPQYPTADGAPRLDDTQLAGIKNHPDRKLAAAVGAQPEPAPAVEPAPVEPAAPAVAETKPVESDGLVKYALAGTQHQQHNLWRGCETIDMQYGEDITVYQQSLVAVGLYPQEKIDGRYGSNTEKATRTLQKKYGIEEDGIAGKDTMVALKIEEMTVLTAKARSGAPLTAEEENRLAAAKQDVAYAVAQGYEMPPAMETQYAAVSERANTRVAGDEKPVQVAPVPQPAAAPADSGVTPIDTAQIQPTDGSITVGGFDIAGLDLHHVQAYAAAKAAVDGKTYVVASVNELPAAPAPGGNSRTVDSIDDLTTGRK